MFGIGMSEMVLIMGVALLVFGPQKLPEVAKTIAKGLRELRKATDDLRSTVMVDFDDDKPTRRATFADPGAAVAVTPATVVTTGSGPSDHAGLTPAGSEPASLAAAPLAVPLPDALPAVVVDDRTEPWPRLADGAVARGSFAEEPPDERHAERMLDGTGADVTSSPTVRVVVPTSVSIDSSSGEAARVAPQARDEER